MIQAFGSYILRSNSIIVTLDIPNGPGRSFRLDRARNADQSTLIDRAYQQSDAWAETRGARLETFRAE